MAILVRWNYDDFDGSLRRAARSAEVETTRYVVVAFRMSYDAVGAPGAEGLGVSQSPGAQGTKPAFGDH